MGPQKTVKHCTLTFSLSTDENHYIESIEVTNQLRGALFIDDGVRANFKSQLLKKPTLLRGRISSLEDKSWQDFSDEEIFINSRTYFDLQQSCGRSDRLDFKFRNTLTIDMDENSYYSGAMGFLSIDSTDTSGNFKIKVNYKRCSRSSYRKNYSQNSRMDRVRQICERNGGRLVGTRCLR